MQFEKQAEKDTIQRMLVYLDYENSFVGICDNL